MGRSYESSVEVALPAQQAEAATYHAMVGAGATAVHGGGGTLRGTMPISWASWGEHLVATIGHGPHGAVVTVRSECNGPQLVDWGRNRKNVEAVVGRLRSLAPVL